LHNATICSSIKIQLYVFIIDSGLVSAR